jgi:hypothetical protein
VPDVVGFVVQLPLVDQLLLAAVPDQVVSEPADAVLAAAMQASVSSPRESGLNERRIMTVSVCFSWDAGAESGVDWGDGGLSHGEIIFPPAPSCKGPDAPKAELPPGRTNRHGVGPKRPQFRLPAGTAGPRQCSVATPRFIGLPRPSRRRRMDQAKRLKDLEKEIARLKRLVADAEFDKAILREAA